MTLTKRSSDKSALSNFPWILLLLSIAAVALLLKLGAGSLAAWDEAIYAQVSKEMVQSGDWMTPHWSYSPWFEKPPLFMWITALSYHIFGISEFAARLPAAVSGLALLWVTYLIGRLAYDEKTGLLAAAILFTCYHFLSFSRFGTMDVMLTLFTYLALYGYLRLNKDNQKWWYLIWSACALALMVKGAGGIIAPAAITLALAFDKRFTEAIRSRYFWQGVMLAVLLVAPWHILMSVWYGRAFIDEYIGYHVVARSTRTLEGHASSYFYYIGRLVDGFFPWCLLVPFAVISATRKNLKDQSRSWVLLILCALVFALYTLIPTRRPWYIIPLYPALAILIAAFLKNVYRNYQARPIHRRLAIAACAFLIIAGGLYSFVSLYLNYRQDEPVATLSRFARSMNFEDKDSLLLLSGVEPIYAQVPLFYSDRPIEQTYTSSEPASVDARRYVNYESLAEVSGTSAKRIILRREDIQLLSSEYDFEVLAEDGSLVYGIIRHRQ
jgi:4-amino-4-deoxy-L-arabinose transferase-like glycosyltransferase